MFTSLSLEQGELGADSLEAKRFLLFLFEYQMLKLDIYLLSTLLTTKRQASYCLYVPAISPCFLLSLFLFGTDHPLASQLPCQPFPGKNGG